MNVNIQGLTFSYHSTPTLNNITIELQKSEVLCIAGPNGSGKSTLLKCINKILQPQQGKILLDDQPLNKISRLETAKKIGYVPQNTPNSNEILSVFEMVLLGRRPHITWQSSQKDEEIVWNALKTLTIEKLAMRNFYELSGGEQQKVLVARSLAQEAKVLLLDEPTSNLDIKHQLEVMDLTRKLVLNKNLTAAIAIHDLNLAARFCDKIIMMKTGKIFAAGQTTTVLTTRNIQEIYEVEVEITYYKNMPHIIPIAPLK
ncbi:MAG: ABC transporter ATP-binding protein [Nitrososphaerota archaeon]|jgi:iron complex transport system ATP-binding protein|nr:ABC transporter ATP-binding protein [Nitrososphaerota archaeon]